MSYLEMFFKNWGWLIQWLTLIGCAAACGWFAGRAEYSAYRAQLKYEEITFAISKFQRELQQCEERFLAISQRQEETFNKLAKLFDSQSEQR